MTARIEQNVVARRRNNRGSSPYTSKSLQRGSANHATMSIALGLTTLIFVSLLGFFYLQQVLSTASQGTDIHALESEIMELREKQKTLELEGAELRSLKTVEDRVKDLNLVDTDKVSYLVTEQDSKVAALTEND